MRRAWMGRAARWQVDAAGFAALALMGFGWYAGLVRPVLDRRASAQQASSLLAERRDLVTRLRGERQEGEVRLAEVKRQVAEQSVRLEPRSHVNQRLDALTTLAQQSGVEVERLAPGETSDTARHGTMLLRLTGRAAYDACESFVERVHERFNDTALTTLRVSSAPGSEEPVTIELELLWFTAPDVRVDAQKAR